jgi:SAM-dependent methyltransferase
MVSHFEKLSDCPICNGKLIESFSTTDFTVSHETFHIEQCQYCSLLLTNPRPDTRSIARYYQSPEYVPHSGSTKGLINRIYQSVKGMNIAFKCRQVIGFSVISKAHILDYGCGRGDFLLAMKKRGWIITGVESDAATAAIASRLCQTNILQPEDLNDLKSESVDVITLWHVLEHIHRLNETMQQLKRILKTTGRLIIAVPNHHSFDARHYGNRWAGYDVPRHLYHFNPKAMQYFFQRHGLQCLSRKALPLDAFYVSMLSEKYNGRALTGLIKGFMIGLLSDFQAIMTGQWSSLIFVCTPCK